MKELDASQSTTQPSSAQNRSCAAGLLALGALNIALISTNTLSFETTMVTTLLLVALAFTFGMTVDHSDLFAPLSFPLLYLAFTLLGPWIYLRISGNAIQSLQPSTTESAATIVMMLTVNAWMCGSVFVKALAPTIPLVATDADDHLDLELSRRLRAWARLLLIGSLAIRLYLAYDAMGRTYGENQLAYTFAAAITPLADGSLIIAACLYMAAALCGDRRLLRGGDAAGLLCAYTVSLLALGSRGELLAPTLILVYAFFKLGQLRTTGILFVGVLAMPILALTANLRSGTGGAPLVETALAAVSSPFMITEWLMDYVPDASGFEHGSTYVGSLKMLAPGVVSRALFPGEPETATFRFREIVGYTNPNQGYSFSLPSEAYLNWGMVGVVGVAFLVGALYAHLFRSQHRDTLRANGYLYVILMSILPYAIRSDALTQLKLFIYPAVMLLVVFALERSAAAAARAWRGVIVTRTTPARGSSR